MSKPLTTEQTVRKVFCPSNTNNTFAKMLYGIVTNRRDVMYLAMCARRLVLMENEQKAEQSHQKFMAGCRSNVGWAGIVKLPKHFGEMKFKAACRKTGRGKG